VHSATLASLLALMVPVVVAAMPLPEPVVREFPELRLAGEGRLRWLGLHIYDAALWVNGAKWNPEREFALDIRYARNLSGERLAGTSIDEMRRLGFGDEARLARWSDDLARVFPDVKKGDRITGVNRPGIGAEFYYQGRLTGRIDDPEFARAFFAIWLDVRTREPRLRESLFGAR
jgi:hypothetical protein